MADETNKIGSPTKKSHAERNAEYFASLEKWLDDFRSMTMTCNLLSGFPFGMMAPSNIPPPPMPQFPIPPLLFNPDLRNQFPNFFQNTFRPAAPVPDEFVEYRIPPIWKRFAAEFVDFLILLFMKLLVTFVAVDFFDLIDFEKYDIEALQKQDKLDYKLALEVTSEVIIVELIHRLIVCFYEAITLCQSIGDQPGGTTAGKAFMGLRVVSARHAISGNDPNFVRVSPAVTLSLPQAIARALLKNLILAVLFPVCFPLFFNKHNRTGYDIICRTIVVEDRPTPARQRR